MSRFAHKPIALPKGVDCQAKPGAVSLKGPKGTLAMDLPAGLEVEAAGGEVKLASSGSVDSRLAGTIRALLANMVTGVSEGFTRKLELVGVGYRASMQGKDLSLNLGFSHPVVFSAPEGITIEVPGQTEILIKGADKQAVGQVAASIRRLRPPEPYKGKGVRHAGERITLKEAKKA